MIAVTIGVGEGFGPLAHLAAETCGWEQMPIRLSPLSEPGSAIPVLSAGAEGTAD